MGENCHTTNTHHNILNIKSPITFICKLIFNSYHITARRRKFIGRARHFTHLEMHKLPFFWGCHNILNSIVTWLANHFELTTFGATRRICIRVRVGNYDSIALTRGADISRLPPACWLLFCCYLSRWNGWITITFYFHHFCSWNTIDFQKNFYSLFSWFYIPFNYHNKYKTYRDEQRKWRKSVATE